MTLLAQINALVSALQGIPAAVTAATTALTSFQSFLNTTS